MQAEGIIKELVLLDEKPSVRIQCDPFLIPAPGQYLLAYADGSDGPLATPVSLAKTFTDPRSGASSFLAAPPIPESWTPGTRLNLRGPLGHGFILPNDARRVALIAYDDSPARLLALLDTALIHEVSIVLVCQTSPDDLPLQIEIQPLTALIEICDWADYIAIDAARESLHELKKKFGMRQPLKAGRDAQILIRTPMPCSALAECGVCAVESRHRQLLACEDGPVFALRDFLD